MRLQKLLSSIFNLILIHAVLVLPALGLEVQASIRGRAAVPDPIVVPPSQIWDGIDGQWSSFGLRVGNPPQNVRVLVSTNSQNTFVVHPLGCSKEAINPVPLQCAKDRGLLFNPNSSTTWSDQGNFGLSSDGIGLEANLGYSLPASYGLETLGLGHVSGDTNGPVLVNQTVAAFASASPFYMGIFGLGTQPLNYSSLGNFSAPSYFVSLRDQNLIPSLSWSYTAGARYQLKIGQTAQLIFGGYDASRFVANTVNFTLANDVSRDIVVAIQSISYTGTTQEVLLPQPIYSFIESTDPNFWLPAEAVAAFERAFGISVDNATGLYLISTSQYATLNAINPSVTFTLANSLSGGSTVDIVLPFKAFILQAAPPFTPNTTSYFPLKLAANSTQYTLGRTFLQEAYLTVNYDTKSFSVSQCTWNDGAVPQIVSLGSKSSLGSGNGGNATTGTPGEGSKKSTGLDTGSKAGIAIGVIAGVAGIGAIVFFLLRRKKQKQPITPTGTTPRATTISPDHTSTTNVVIKNEPDTDMWSLSNKQDQVTPIHPLHHARSELSAISDTARELPAEDNREGDYSTEERRMRSLRKAHRTPELDSADFYELDGGPVSSLLSRVREERYASTTNSSPIERSPSTTQYSELGVSPIDSFGFPRPHHTPEQQNSWLDMSPHNTPNVRVVSQTENNPALAGLVSPMSPHRQGSNTQVGNSAASRGPQINRTGSSRVSGPLSSNLSETSARSTRSARSGWTDSDLYSVR
ncbi:Acid protease [Glarea lozoyensis ATCC 20868]|uniref:Acid protease n=1 Tax=Glarea lozoyensis (strain ATCC 20868 / MF5171) TaxID=1116229 RepID=S3DHJ3_GLAL2|nr:Acid protease [Glarea lozoyensis ATCC 20868]EPE36619.1 Acid protease [Glarea lozoyensis ATCC 20868]